MRFLIFFLLLLVSCNKPEVTEFSGIACHVPYRIVIEDPIHDPARITSLIEGVFHQVNQIFNNWNPNSEISKLGKAPINERVNISNELRDLLLLAKKIHGLTQGRFDPTVAPSVELLKKGKIAALQSKGLEYLHIEGDECWKEKELNFDLCGIAKGHAVDLLLKEILGAGYENVFVEWGGEIGVSGHKKWKIALPDSKVLLLKNQSVATSGSYLQNWEIDGKHYTHIIDPVTGKPLEMTQGHTIAVTVVRPSCAEADALATALMLYKKEEALEWAKKNNIECYLITK